MSSWLRRGSHARLIAPQALRDSLHASRTKQLSAGASQKCRDRQLTGLAGNISSIPATIAPWWPQRPNICRFQRDIAFRKYATVMHEIKPPPLGRMEFPFPPHPNPTPHEIFHLPRTATPPEIKARYYQLVRYHHPDSHHCRCLPGDQAHARFQQIIAAYDYLRGATSSPHPGAKRYGFDPGHSNFDPYLHELARRRRAQQAAYNNRHWTEGFGAPKESRADDFDQNGSKERRILALGVLVLVIGLYPGLVLFPFGLEKTHRAAVMNLAQARSEAREMGEQRRTEIRKRVESMQRDSSPVTEGSGSGGSISSSVEKA